MLCATYHEQKCSVPSFTCRVPANQVAPLSLLTNARHIMPAIPSYLAMTLSLTPCHLAACHLLLDPVLLSNVIARQAAPGGLHTGVILQALYALHDGAMWIMRKFELPSSELVRVALQSLGPSPRLVGAIGKVGVDLLQLTQMNSANNHHMLFLAGPDLAGPDATIR